MDHPGFEVTRRIGAGRVRAKWRGGVELSYFKGARVRFFVNGKWVKGTIKAVKPLKTKPGAVRRADTVEVELQGSADVPPGSLGMWDLPKPALRGKRVVGPGCDDMAGLAGILCMLEVLCRKRANATVYCLFTRAEEVGFAGCLSGCVASTLPKRCAVVGIECSSELPTAKLGDGPILRVGDRMSVFSPRVGDYCREVAEGLVSKGKGFRYQRKLMDGGACESTAFCAYGYEATGICLPLGNYHNMNKSAKRIDSEYIDAGDFANMVEWFVALATCRRRFDANGDGGRKKMLESLRRKHERRLARTV
jgi:endoglucanase